MDYEQIAKLTVSYGLGVVLSIAMAIFMAWLLKYVLHQNEIREQRLADIISKDIASINKSLDDHDTRTIAVLKNVEEAQRYQRQEHEVQIKILEQLKDETDRRREVQIGIISSLADLQLAFSNLNRKIGMMVDK